MVRQTLENPNRYGCLLIGPAGIGRTTVMNLALQDVEANTPIHRFRGSEKLRDRELGILEIVLSQAGASRAIGAGAALSTLAKIFARDTATTTSIPIVRVDNANLVDETSLSVLCQLAEAKRIRLVAGAESVRSPVDLIAKLWLTGKLIRIDLTGLDEAAIAALAATSERNTKSAAELRRETSGNPRLLNHLLFEERELPAQERSQWKIPDGIKSLAEICAVTGAVPYEALAELCPVEQVDDMADSGLVIMSRGRDAAVMIAEPFVAEALRAQIMPSHGLRLFKTLQEVIDVRSLHGRALLGYVRWSLSLGYQQPTDQVFEAMLWANSKGHFADAAGLAEMTEHESLELTLEQIRAEKSMGKLDSANRRFTHLLENLDTGNIPSTTLSRIASMDLRLADPRAPENLRTIWARELLDTPKDLGRLGVTKARFDQRGGRLTESRDLAENVYRNHACWTRHRQRGCAILGFSEVCLGRIDIGLHYIKQAELMFRLPGMTSFELEDAAPQLFAARYVAGDWEGARNTHLPVDAGERMHNFISALVDIRTGHPARAQAALAEVLEQDHEEDFVDIVRIGRAAKRYADALLGNPVNVDEGIGTEWSDSRVDRYSWWSDFETTLFDLQSQALIRPERAAPKLFDLARTALDREALTLAALAMMDAARFGHQGAAVELAQVAPKLEGALGHLAVTMSHALREDTAASLLEAARENYEFGAAIVCSDLARLAQKRAVVDNDRKIVREARILAGNSTRMMRIGTGAKRFDSMLTGFERRLVDGVVEGSSSQELGVIHHLSARTIEWHLSRIYQRLQVGNRRELRDVVSNWKEDS